MVAKKKKTMSRDDAAELYRDLQSTMQRMKGKPEPQGGNPKSDVAKEIAMAIRQGLKNESQQDASAMSSTVSTMPETETFFDVPESRAFRGEFAAIAAVVMFAFFKLTISALEASGIGEVQQAHATAMSTMRKSALAAPGMRREEVKILTALDQRRKELQERGQKLDEQEVELDRRDREFAARLTELRELTNRAQTHREKDSRKKNNQLEQLSNVYGSMNPTEAAQLIEQLDISIALALLERMPEKRIGQILALMSPERALALTRMLSGTAASDL